MRPTLFLAISSPTSTDPRWQVDASYGDNQTIAVANRQSAEGAPSPMATIADTIQEITNLKERGDR